VEPIALKNLLLSFFFAVTTLGDKIESPRTASKESKAEIASSLAVYELSAQHAAEICLKHAAS